MATRPDELYEADFYAWTRDQAAALRRLAGERWSSPLDLGHLADEVEGAGKADRDAVRGRLRRIIEHCLKLEHSPAPEPRLGWKIAIDEARDEIGDRLTATIRLDLEEEFSRLYGRTLEKVRKELAGRRETEAAKSLPAENPYTLDDLLTDEWYPPSRHGTVDET